ncbi:hypothetical protein INT45_001625 [Circinella minor]|uniref:Uncharacterized protein n=1 Tax=Circinella minor TaxID=1195481 RepID=A0A8H7RZP6_9FUNG|nr:hypothetical protein INT45_001625 [Circinella minor]
MNPNIIDRSHTLSKINVATTNWFDIQKTTLPFLNDAGANNNKIEMIAANNSSSSGIIRNRKTAVKAKKRALAKSDGDKLVRL